MTDIAKTDPVVQRLEAKFRKVDVKTTAKTDNSPSASTISTHLNNSFDNSCQIAADQQWADLEVDRSDEEFDDDEDLFDDDLFDGSSNDKNDKNGLSGLEVMHLDGSRTISSTTKWYFSDNYNIWVDEKQSGKAYGAAKKASYESNIQFKSLSFLPVINLYRSSFSMENPEQSVI